MTQKGSNAYNSPKYTGISIQTSAQGLCIPYIAGAVRAGTNLIWYGDFVKTPIKNGKGGKGGGKGSQLYKYSAAVMLGLCEGPVQSINQVWVDQSITTLAKLGLTLFTGTASQSPWSYMVSHHPSQALSYAYTAYLANESYQLGESPALPNHNFEIVSLFSGTMPGTVDVNLADVIPDYLNNPQYGQVITTIDSTSLAFFKTYCQAQGLWFSVLRDKAEQASQTLDRWATLTNTWIAWSGSSLKFVPLGDTAITANGVTYTPNMTIQYDLTETDFLGGGVPVTTERSDPADRPNHVKLQVKDRSNAYNVASVEWQDQGLVDQFGRVDSSVTDASEICDLAVGNLVAQFIGQRGAYIANTYSFKVGYEIGTGLEFGDLCTIQSGKSGIPNPLTVRIRTTDEDKSGNWSVLAEGVVQGTGTVVPGAQPSGNGGFIDVQVDPGDINFPMVFEPTSDLTSGIPQLWLAASGGADWGGAVVYVSFDNITYTAMGAVTAPAWQGNLTSLLASHSDPDHSGSFSVDLTPSLGIMDTSATHADADAFRTLVLLTNNVPGSFAIPTNGEMISYGSVVAGGGPYSSTVSYLRRGLYGTTIGTHPVGTNFCRFDLNSVEGLGNSVFTYLIPPQYIGTTIYFKFASFNSFGNAIQDISGLSDYTYVPTGVGYGSVNGAPATPTGFTGSPSSNGAYLTWTIGAPTDNITSYQIWGAVGTSVVFGSCSLMYTTYSLNALVPNLLANTGYTFYVVASNKFGSSTPSSALNLTTGPSAITGSSYRAVTYSTSPVTLLNTDAYVDITNTFGPNLVVKMPPAPTNGQRIVLMDAGGNAGTNTIILKNNAGSVQLDQIIVNSGWTNPEMWTGSTWRQTS